IRCENSAGACTAISGNTTPAIEWPSSTACVTPCWRSSSFSSRAISANVRPVGSRERLQPQPGISRVMTRLKAGAVSAKTLSSGSQHQEPCCPPCNKTKSRIRQSSVQKMWPHRMANHKKTALAGRKSGMNFRSTLCFLGYDRLRVHITFRMGLVDDTVSAFETIVKQRPHATVEVVTDVFHVVGDGLVVQLHTAEKHRAIENAALVPGVAQAHAQGILIQIVPTLVVHMTLAG